VLLAIAVGCIWCLSSMTFIAVKPETPNTGFNPTVAASAALPVLATMADAAEAKMGDASRRWSSILVPLTTLVFPGVVMGAFVLYSFQEDAWWQLTPGSKKSQERTAAWREHPLFANIKDPQNGLLNKDDFEKGLEEAWEKAKPANSPVSAKDKLKELSTMNAPHFWQNQLTGSA